VPGLGNLKSHPPNEKEISSASPTSFFLQEKHLSSIFPPPNLNFE